ncbi:MAG TPA: alpha/beta hydrolase [Solirubrobacterales bacterium]|jgi:pimeloyl-ACP methyl ester carboxylesterase
MGGIEVIRAGEGPEVLLVHGGASPPTTWAGLEGLRARWTLASAYRRGYPPSPPAAAGRQDWEVDAEDVGALLDGRPHLVAHSYGGLGALIAAGRDPDRVRSVTVIEPPIYFVSEEPEVARFERMGDEVLTRGLDADPGTLREFLRVAGVQVGDGPLPEKVAAGVRRAHGGRLPGAARPDLEALRQAGVPALVASGDHAPSIEMICDGLAAALGAERAIAPGAGHFVAAAPGFAERLERFLLGSGA